MLVFTFRGRGLNVPVFQVSQCQWCCIKTKTIYSTQSLWGTTVSWTSEPQSNSMVFSITPRLISLLYSIVNRMISEAFTKARSPDEWRLRPMISFGEGSTMMDLWKWAWSGTSREVRLWLTVMNYSEWCRLDYWTLIFAFVDARPVMNIYRYLWQPWQCGSWTLTCNTAFKV